MHPSVAISSASSPAAVKKISFCEASGRPKLHPTSPMALNLSHRRAPQGPLERGGRSWSCKRRPQDPQPQPRRAPAGDRPLAVGPSMRGPPPAVHLRPAAASNASVPMRYRERVAETSPVRCSCCCCIRTRRPQATLCVQSAARRSTLAAYLLACATSATNATVPLCERERVALQQRISSSRRRSDGNRGRLRFLSLIL